MEFWGDGCASCYTLFINIIDLVTDERVWSLDGPDQYNDGITSVPDAVLSLSDRTADAFAQHGINPELKGRVVKGDAFSAAGRDYAIEVESRTEERDMEVEVHDGSIVTVVLNAIAESSIWITSPGLRRKTVHTMTIEDSQIEAHNIFGAIISPDEKRSALVREQLYNDLNTGTHRRWYSLVGAHLSVGFR